MTETIEDRRETESSDDSKQLRAGEYPPEVEKKMNFYAGKLERPETTYRAALQRHADMGQID